MTYLSDWLLNAEGWEPGILSALVAPPSRGYGKSLLMGDLFRAAREPAVTSTRGTDEPGIIILDEYDFPFDGLRSLLKPKEFPRHEPFIFPGDLLAEFEDPEFPECTVYASIDRMDKRDPRNPNPAAGTVRRFYVTRDGYQELVRNKTTAIAKAKTMHERLVAEAKAKIAEEKRQLAIRQAEIFEEARRNHEHLQALPAYGGF
jgi:hypothetical protein